MALRAQADRELAVRHGQRRTLSDVSDKERSNIERVLCAGGRRQRADALEAHLIPNSYESHLPEYRSARTLSR
jgi:hypothetical protein